MSRRRGSGSVYKQPGCSTWTISFFRRGKRIRESTHQTKYSVARNLLNERLAAVAKGVYVQPDRHPIMVSECYQMLRQRYLENRCRSVDALARRWAHLKLHFGEWEAQCVTEHRLDDYVAARLKEGAAPGTVNRELAVLKAAFRIGYQKQRVQRVPVFPHLREASARQGFVEDGDYARLVANASALWLRLFVELAFTYGWRRGELLGLRVRQCDLITRCIRLEAVQSKNGQPREIIMTQKVLELVKLAVVGKSPDDFLLTREGGKPVKDFRRAWRSLAIKAGLGRMVCRACEKTVTGTHCECGTKLRPKYTGRIVHDFRRSAARQLRRAGVAESVIMKVAGWQTAQIFRRYAIVSDADQRDAVAMLEARRRETAEQARAVEPLREITVPESPIN